MTHLEPPARPLAFFQEQRVFTGDPEGFGAVLAELLPVAGFQAEPAAPAGFRGQLSHVHLGSIRAVALSHSAAAWRVERQHRPCLLMVMHGHLELTLATGREQLQASGEMMYLPPATWRWRSEGVNALVLCLDPPQLARCLEACGSPRDGWRLPRRIDADHPAQAALLAALSRLLPLVDLQGSLAPAQLELLQLDGLLHRLVAMLLAGCALVAADPPPALLGADAAPGLAPLLHWIEGNLDRNLTLSDLERASGYSGRALQYAFKRRFGCGPMRWVRQRRLERAREVLLGRASRPSLSQLAGQVGYVNQSAFSRDFRQAFGVTPSALIGRGCS